jgi:hypothetical protein
VEAPLALALGAGGVLPILVVEMPPEPVEARPVVGEVRRELEDGVVAVAGSGSIRAFRLTRGMWVTCATYLPSRGSSPDCRSSHAAPSCPTRELPCVFESGTPTGDECRPRKGGLPSSAVIGSIHPEREGRGQVKEREGPGPVSRFLPLAVAAVLLVVRLVVAPPAWGTTTELALWGFGLLAFATVMHVIALRFPGHYAVEGAAWVATIVVGFVIVVLLIPVGGN